MGNQGGEAKVCWITPREPGQVVERLKNILRDLIPKGFTHIKIEVVTPDILELRAEIKRLKSGDFVWVDEVPRG